MPNHYITPKKENEEKAEEKKEKKKDEFSSWSVFFGVLLTAALTAIWERAFIDLTHYFNPYYENCQAANSVIVQKFCNLVQYETVRLLLHITLVIPLLIVLVAIAYVTSGKKLKSHSRIILRAYFFSVLIISIHLFVEFANFLFRYYREVGNYVILVCIAIAFIVFIVYLQKRFNRPKEV